MLTAKVYAYVKVNPNRRRECLTVGELRRVLNTEVVPAQPGATLSDMDRLGVVDVPATAAKAGLEYASRGTHGHGLYPPGRPIVEADFDDCLAWLEPCPLAWDGTGASVQPKPWQQRLAGFAGRLIPFI